MSALRSLRSSAVAAIIAVVVCGVAQIAGAVTTTLVEPSSTGAGVLMETNSDRYHRVVLPDNLRVGRPLVVVLPGTAKHPSGTMTSLFAQPSLGIPRSTCAT